MRIVKAIRERCSGSECTVFLARLRDSLSHFVSEFCVRVNDIVGDYSLKGGAQSVEPHPSRHHFACLHMRFKISCNLHFTAKESRLRRDENFTGYHPKIISRRGVSCSRGGALFMSNLARLLKNTE